MKQEITVVLESLSDVMFDRFYDHSKEDRPPEQKLYLDTDSTLFLPSENIYSFLVRDMPPTGVIRRVEKRGAKEYIDLVNSALSIHETRIPFIGADEQPIKFAGFTGDERFYINDWSAGITKMSGGKAVKQEPRKRPVLRHPWLLKFEMTIWQNEKVSSDKLLSWFEHGGQVVALGSYRPRHGRFIVSQWEVKQL